MWPRTLSSPWPFLLSPKDPLACPLSRARRPTDLPSPCPSAKEPLELAMHLLHQGVSSAWQDGTCLPPPRTSVGGWWVTLFSLALPAAGQPFLPQCFQQWKRQRWPSESGHPLETVSYRKRWEAGLAARGGPGQTVGSFVTGIDPGPSPSQRSSGLGLRHPSQGHRPWCGQPLASCSTRPCGDPGVGGGGLPQGHRQEWRLAMAAWSKGWRGSLNLPHSRSQVSQNPPRALLAKVSVTR